MEKEVFIKRSNIKHHNKYNYSKLSNNIKTREKEPIICPTHGEFWQTPSNHLSGKGCSLCAREYNIKCRKITKEIFIQKSQEIHKNEDNTSKYLYDEVDYVDYNTKVCIICPKHGKFYITPHSHLSKHGCKKCANEQMQIERSKSQNQFQIDAIQIHGDKYIYDKVNYINGNTKVCIICPKHGEFWQRPNDHLNGKGCPLCKSSKLENLVKFNLTNNNIEFEQQKRFDWLRTNKGYLFLDFYLPKYNIAIECQGIQHFKPIDRFGGEQGYKENIERDNIKRTLCEENNVKLLYFSNLKIDYPYEVYNNIKDLIDKIKKKYD